MAKQSKQWAAIIIMIALFGMIAFVTNLCSPMAVIVKNQFGASDTLAQIGNYGNFIAYLVMGIPSGMLIAKYGYKKTALIALVVGIVGILLEYLSGAMGSFLVYLIGAFVSGFCMCMLNTVVNPMLNNLGGGGKTGNQLIQIGGSCNSACAVAVYIIMGALIGDAAKAKIEDATPALMIALAVFILAFVIIMFTKIEEPEQAPVDMALVKGAFKFRHFTLGALAIFLYMSVEVGTPTYMLSYLTASPDAPTLSGLGMDGSIAGLICAVYWLMMFVGRMVGSVIGAKVSSRAMVSTAAVIAIVLLLFGIFNSAADAAMVTVPGIDWGNLNVVWAQVPIGIFAFLLVGLCTSVMWGSIFNMAVEKLGKYTAVASGIFMTMVFGCAVMVFVQAQVGELIGSYTLAYIIPVLCAGYILFYALVGSRVSKTTEE